MTPFESKGEPGKGVCYIENGCLYWNNGSGATIQEPSLLVCEDDNDGTCTLIRYGEAKFLRKELREKLPCIQRLDWGV